MRLVHVFLSFVECNREPYHWLGKQRLFMVAGSVLHDSDLARSVDQAEARIAQLASSRRQAIKQLKQLKARPVGFLDIAMKHASTIT